MKSYCVYANSQHHVIDGDAHEVKRGKGMGGDEELKIMKDGKVVFEAFGYFTFTASAEGSSYTVPGGE